MTVRRLSLRVVGRAPARTMQDLVTLAAELDVRQAASASHSQTVARYARATALGLGLDHRDADAVHLAGLLHDIGKLALPDEVLRKPGALSESEWAEMREHPRIGATLLADAGLDDICDWVLAHHERPDGSGYPNGLRGSEIPLQARIIAVADSYEAMTSDRAYCSAVTHREARVELRRHCHAQFDETVVEAFLATAATAVAAAR